MKVGSTKQLLGNIAQREVLSKLHTCEQQKASALNGRAEDAGKKQKILIQTKKVQPTFARKKNFENLSQKGKASVQKVMNRSSYPINRTVFIALNCPE